MLRFEKYKAYLSFKDNFWGDDLTEMQLISKYNQVIQLLLCVIDISSKHAQSYKQ